jgi:hypothetical protein
MPKSKILDVQYVDENPLAKCCMRHRNPPNAPVSALFPPLMLMNGSPSVLYSIEPGYKAGSTNEEARGAVMGDGSA